MENIHFEQLLDYFSLSHEGYRRVRKGVKKRIRRHMQQLQCPDMASYLALIKKQAELRRQCELLLTVSISRFFRDFSLWQMLETEILPKLLRLESVNVWSAGCACGEEVYSLKMIWEHLKLQSGSSSRLLISATDVNPNCIEIARIGIYGASSLREVPENWTERCFAPCSKRRYAVKEALKKDIVWQVGRIDAEMPPSGFHMVFFRNNLLTYLQKSGKQKAFKKMITSLNRGGFLVIGHREKLPCDCSELTRFCGRPEVFVKQL